MKVGEPSPHSVIFRTGLYPGSRLLDCLNKISLCIAYHVFHFKVLANIHPLLGVVLNPSYELELGRKVDGTEGKKEWRICRRCVYE